MGRSFEEAVAAVIDEEDDQVRAVFGERSSGEVASGLRAHVGRVSGGEIVACPFDFVSVGVTFEVELADGRRLVLKAMPSDPTGQRAGAIEVQRWLRGMGFPAPEVLAPLQACLGAEVYAMQACDRGEQVTYDAGVRETMACELARLVELTEGLDPSFTLPTVSPAPERLWPTPHSAIFDFEGTVATAGPIAAIAQRARHALRQAEGREVVVHGDWSLQNMGFRDGRVVSVFDWDSAARMSELRAVAGAAAFHAQDWYRGPDAYPHDFYPGPEATLAFVDIYARARGLAFTADQRRMIEATLVYRLAYQARCEHALDPTTDGPASRRLRAFADTFGLGG